MKRFISFFRLRVNYFQRFLSGAAVAGAGKMGAGNTAHVAAGRIYGAGIARGADLCGGFARKLRGGNCAEVLRGRFARNPLTILAERIFFGNCRGLLRLDFYLRRADGDFDCGLIFICAGLGRISIAA
jgi:hypothetical protein